MILCSASFSKRETARCNARTSRRRDIHLKLGLINSAWLGTPVDTATGIRLTKEIGFDTIDIFADPLEIAPQERRLIRKACQKAGLPVTSVVCCTLGIADFNKSVRDFHVIRAKRYLDLGYELEAVNMLLVLGEYIWQQEVIAPRDQWNWAVEQVRGLAEYAGSLGLEIAIELEPFQLSIVNSIDEMSDFLSEVNHPAAKANVDISHLVLAHDGPENVQKLAGRIAHVHLSDCDGKKHGDLPPGRGVVNFRPYLQALQDAGFNGTVSIELEYSPEPDKISDWVREAYQSTSRIMSSLGIRSAAA
jgi:sugar phosphate isomerase/epimerase